MDACATPGKLGIEIPPLEHDPIKLDRIMLYLSFVSRISEPADDAICLENALERAAFNRT